MPTGIRRARHGARHRSTSEPYLCQNRRYCTIQTMSLEEADKIRLAFGKFIEVANPGLMRLFQTTIPESTLPYPKKQIEQAMDTCIEFLEQKNDKKAARAYEGLKLWL